ncbi:hypothetical protein CLIB1423_11S03224 [[Candida] railenensis]|uniref:RRM domain-containing protein n=1 Tax=[Candida] railenensis TaxID=45579 RepID=A0A9P0VZI9_9ASCO|nr:hypothetical protein CLIB1423_11S03224 [[Candida] railenensis]
MPKNTLYVTGFTRESKAVDLAPEFEKYGDLVRLDIPPPRTDDGEKFAFVEYKDYEDSQKALELNGKTLPFSIGSGLTVQEARSDPYSTRGGRGSRGGFRGRGSSRGPRGSRGGYGYGGGYGRDYDPRDDYGPPPPRDYRGGRGGYRGGYEDSYDRGYDNRDRGYDRGYDRDRDYERGGYDVRDRGYPPRGSEKDYRSGGERSYRDDRDRPTPEESSGGDSKDYGRGRYSRSPSRSPVGGRDRSRSPERY